MMGALLMHWSRVPFGVTGLDVGTGFQVALVNGFSAGGEDLGQVAKLAPDADHERRRRRIDEAVRASVSVRATPTADALTPQKRTHDRRSASVELGSLGEAAATTEGSKGSTDSYGGDPLAVDLLNQIARCLPPMERPSLRFSQLTLAIGDDGRLRTPPEVRSTFPRLTEAERLAADRIVQAALLCGPYNKPEVAGRVVSLAADFSSVSPRAVRGRGKGA